MQKKGIVLITETTIATELITVATDLYCETLIDMIQVHIMLICTIISCRPVGDQ